MARAEEDHRYTQRDDGGAQPVEAVRPVPVDRPAPQQAHDDEHPAVGGVYPAEIGAGLERRDDSVARQDDRAGHADRPGRPLAQPPPDQVAAADLGQPGGDEQPDAPNDGHRPTIAPGLIRAADWARNGRASVPRATNLVVYATAGVIGAPAASVPIRGKEQ